MNDQIESEIADDTHQAQAAVRTRCGRPPLWAILLSVSLVAVDIIGRRRLAPNFAKGAGASSEVKHDEPAQTPSQLPQRGWKDILLRVFHGISDDRILLIAAGVTFYAILALFPSIGAIVSIYGLFADPSRIVAHLDALSGFAPAGAVDVLREQLLRLAQQDRSALGLGFTISLVISLWTAKAGISGLFDALTAVYQEKEKRSLVKYYSVVLAFTVGAVVLVLLSLAILIALPFILDHIRHPSIPSVLLKIARWPVLFVLVVLALSIVYRLGPCRAAPQWRWITWGSAFAAIAWLVASALFSWYVANFGSYNRTYGSLGAIIGFMTWIWVSIIVVLVGAKLDAEIEHRTTRASSRSRIGALW